MTRPVAVVVAFRAGERAARAVRELRQSEPELPVVLVGVETPAAQLASVASALDGVVLVPLADNRGFAGGANAGLQRAFAGDATHAVLLNDDVLLERGCVAALVAAAGVDGAAAPVLEAPGPESFAGGAIDWRGGYGRHVPGALDFLTGAALCVSRGAWERVGAFDERLFLYYEDVDWSLRARRLGVPLRVAWEARARHEAGASTGGANGATWGYYSTRNRLAFLERHRGRRAAVVEALRTAARVPVAAASGRSSAAVARARLEGVRDWARGRSGQGPYPR